MQNCCWTVRHTVLMVAGGNSDPARFRIDSPGTERCCRIHEVIAAAEVNASSPMWSWSAAKQNGTPKARITSNGTKARNVYARQWARPQQMPAPDASARKPNSMP